MKKKIFISYRRNDTQYQVDDLYDILIQNGVAKESIFKDIESIGVGENYEDAIDQALEACDVCLVAIGPNWVSEENKARLHSKDDYVQKEIAKALIKKKVLVVPVLFDSSMPEASDLPKSIKELSLRNAFEVSRRHKEADIAELIEKLEIVKARKRKQAGQKITRRLSRVLQVILALFVGMVLLAVIIPSIVGGAGDNSVEVPFEPVVNNDPSNEQTAPPLFDAAVYYPDYGKYYFFSRSFYSGFDYEEGAFAEWADYSTYWPSTGMAGYFDAAVFYPERSAIYFFKGDSYTKWDISSNSAAPEYPLPIEGYWDGVWTEGIDAAFYHIREQNVYFFKEGEYLVYNAQMEQVESGPHKITEGFPGLAWSENLDAALILKDSASVAFFKGEEYIVYDLVEKVPLDNNELF